MTWPLKLLGVFDHLPTARDMPHQDGVGWQPEPGNCFFHDGFIEPQSLGSDYLRTHKPHRLPLFVWCPKGGWWSPDQRFSGADGWYGEGWSVTGQVPYITVKPSINFPGIFHGWVTDGVLTQC